MSNDLYWKLVDLYAGRELSTELEETLRTHAEEEDADLARELEEMRQTVDALRSIPPPEFTEESYQRVLMKLYARGAEVEPKTPPPAHFQYHLPLQG
jgi:hypothetical protein